MKTLIVIAPDGERKREGEFADIDAAWRRANDMGSRWFFYPVCIVATGNCDRSKIVAVPHGMPSDWIGHSLKRLCDCFAGNSEHVCDWVNGKTNFAVWP